MNEATTSNSSSQTPSAVASGTESSSIVPSIQDNSITEVPSSKQSTSIIPTAIQSTIASDAKTVSVNGPTANAMPETIKPLGRTKGLVHNATIILTEMFSQLSTMDQLINRAPSTRGDILNNILKARDGLIQVQDLLKED